MKLIDLISYFRSGEDYESFCKEQALSAESEAIEIYGRKPLYLDSPLGFFPIEETGGLIEFQWEGVPYQNLFDFFYFLEVIEDAKGNDKLGNTELAQILLTYALNDA